MSIGSGLGSQFGIGEETTYGTAVVPSRFLEFDKETFTRDRTVQQGEGLRAGGLLGRASRRTNTLQNPKGTLSLEVVTRGMGLLLKHTLGTVTTTSLAGGAATLQQFTLGNRGGLSLTGQVGVPQLGGTVLPKNITGLKVDKTKFSMGVGGLLMADVDFVGQDVSYAAPALAVASYSSAATTSVFNYNQATVSIGATTFPNNALTTGGSTLTNAREFECTFDTVQADDRYNQGNNGRRSEPIQAGWQAFEGQIVTENTDTVFRDLYENDATFTLVETLTGPIISGTTAAAIQFVFTACRLKTPNSPQVGGPELVKLTNAYDILDDGTNPPVIVNYVTADTAP